MKLAYKPCIVNLLDFRVLVLQAKGGIRFSGQSESLNGRFLMHVMILGSGVIGVSVAYELARTGHQVTILDRQSGSALETSFANAGEVSPGYSAPWAGPGVPLKALQWLSMQHSPLVIRLRWDWSMLRWMASMLRNCTTERYNLNKGRMVRLAEYSRDCLKDVREQTGIQYDHRTQGTLQLFRTQKQLDHTAVDIAILQRYGVPYQLLDRTGCLKYEPGLATAGHKFVGGLLLPGDETGDCFMYTQQLAAKAAAMGVRFSYNTEIQALVGGASGLEGVQTSAGLLKADSYVLALGSYSPLLLRPLSVHLPIYPIKGYSLTVPITLPEIAPESTVMDETYKVAVTRLGGRIRVGGTAELGGYDMQLPDSRRQTLAFVVNDLFPGGSDTGRAEFWCGLRPMTPDGTPILGRSPLKNLYLSTGHGTLGWTMAAGTGRVMADLISGRPAQIDMEGLGLDRYS
jgi:D-amino-acid dehydrogenase